MEDNCVQCTKSVGLAHSLLSHHIASRNESPLSCLWPYCSISRVMFNCVFFYFTSLVVSEACHSRMGWSDVAVVLGLGAFLYFRLLHVVELRDILWLFGNTS